MATQSEVSKRRAYGRSLSDFPDLSEVEKQFIWFCRFGQLLVKGTSRPSEPSHHNKIRASLIRFMALGGDFGNTVHERGVRLEGAWISGDLDIEGCHCSRALFFENCKFEGAILARDAIVPRLVLRSCETNQIEAVRLRCNGTVHLKGLTAHGKLNFESARIKGGMILDGAELHERFGYSINFKLASIKGDLLLRADNQRSFKAKGLVRLSGARIGGDIKCHSAVFARASGQALNCDAMRVKGDCFFDGNEVSPFVALGEVSMVSAEIGGVFSCRHSNFGYRGERALDCQGLTVKGALLLDKDFSALGPVVFNTATVDVLVDNCRDVRVDFVLDGLTYARLAGQKSSTKGEDRVCWLNKQPSAHLGNEFKAQPWEQVIKVLREMGHPEEAQKVAIAKQEARKKAGNIGGRLSRWLHYFYGEFAGYGHRPLATFAYMAAIWLLCAQMFSYADRYGMFAPSNPIIHNDHNLQAACGRKFGARETCWTICKKLPQEYTTFNALVYSLDLIMPVVNLGQEQDWAPLSTDDNAVGIPLAMFIRLVMWLEILFGWAMSLLLVGVLGNLVKKD